ncbi:ribonuclease H-like domain-containing protein [Tanacetum coccineum]
MYENFSAPSTKSLDSIFNRLQKIDTHVVVWKNKPDLDTMRFDDLYNNFKIVEQEVKETASSSSNSNSHNMAFVSSPSSTNEVNTAYGVSNANTQVSPATTQVSTASTQVSTDDIEEMDLKWQLALLSMRTRRECKGPRNQDSMNRNQDSSRRTVNVEETSSKAMLAIDGVGSQMPDKSRKGLGFVCYNAVPPPPPTGLFLPLKFDLSNSSLEEFQQPEFEGYGPKTSKSVSEDISNEVRESPDATLVKELVSDDKLEKNIAFPTIAKIEFVRPKQQEKPVRKPVKYAEMYSYCNFHKRERMVSGNNYTRMNYNYSAKKAHPIAHRNMAPRAVLMKTGLRPLNTARPVNTAHPKTTVYSARPMPKAVVNAVRTNQVNAVKDLAYWVWRPTKLNSALITLKKHNYGHPQKEDQGYVDSGCSRYMTGNTSISQTLRNLIEDMLPLEEEPKEGKLLTSRNLMEDMLPLGEEPNKEKLLMCDKKNSVLFTDTGCFVLSPDFKLADESHVLLKVPRKNNMYSVDMKNIVPKESLTCLVTKATLDESMLWHRRLGHVNFKTINKLVKENLVRGLPTKHFENDQTYVAYLKGKQHKASYTHLTGSSNL